MRVLVLVLSFDSEPYRTIEHSGQRATWASEDISDAPVRWYHGTAAGPRYWTVRSALRAGRLHRDSQRALLDRLARKPATVKAEGDTLKVDLPDVWATITLKMLNTFRYVLDTFEFDYLWRTNSPSYVNRRLLLEWADSLPRTSCYAGSLWGERGPDFVTGSGFMLSRDMVEWTLTDPNFDPMLLDDQAVSKSMKNAGTTPAIVCNRIDLGSADAVENLSEEHLRSIFHYRCKNYSDRLGDVDTMLRLHDRLSRRADRGEDV